MIILYSSTAGRTLHGLDHVVFTTNHYGEQMGRSFGQQFFCSGAVRPHIKSALQEPTRFCFVYSLLVHDGVPWKEQAELGSRRLQSTQVGPSASMFCFVRVFPLVCHPALQLKWEQLHHFQSSVFSKVLDKPFPAVRLCS